MHNFCCDWLHSEINFAETVASPVTFRSDRNPGLVAAPSSALVAALATPDFGIVPLSGFDALVVQLSFDNLEFIMVVQHRDVFVWWIHNSISSISWAGIFEVRGTTTGNDCDASGRNWNGWFGCGPHNPVPP